MEDWFEQEKSVIKAVDWIEFFIGVLFSCTCTERYSNKPRGRSPCEHPPPLNPTAKKSLVVAVFYRALERDFRGLFRRRRHSWLGVIRCELSI